MRPPEVVIRLPLEGVPEVATTAEEAEQDRLAAKLWDGGRGARNWDGAAIVGLL